MNRQKKRTERTGLTLMELVIVLTILVALGGIVAALLPNFLTKAHDSVTVTNIAEVNKSLMGYLSTNLAYPDYFDSIVNTQGAIYSMAAFSPTAPFGSQAVFGGVPVFTALPLTTGETQSLIAGGINNLMVMQDPPSSDGATFGAYLGPPGTAGASVAISGVPTVLKVASATYMQQVAHIPPPRNTSLVFGTDYNYVVFGLGPYCTIVGDPGFGIFEAPVSFGEHYYESAQNAYARMLVIFRVYNSGQRCEFLGSAHPDPTGFGTATMHTEEFYQTQ